MMLGLAPVVLYAGFVIARAGHDLYLAGDQPVLEMATRDAFHFHAELGPYSRFRWNHPGPAIFYWFAPFYALTGERASGFRLAATAMVLIGLGHIVRTVQRSLGVGAGLVAAWVVVAFLVVSGVRWIDNAWNPIMVIVPVAVVGVAAAAVCDGRRWQIVTAGVAASFATQTHVGTGPVAGVLASVAVVGAVLAMRRERAFWVMPVIVAGLACAAMWALPVHEQLTNSPGNLGEVVSFARRSPVTHSVKDILGPTSTQFTLSQPDMIDQVRHSSGSPLVAWRAAALAVTVGVLLAATVYSVRRRDRFNAALTGGAMVAGGALVFSLRRAQGALDGYLTLTATSIGLLAWLGLALTAAQATRLRPAARRVRPALPWVVATSSLFACAFAVHAARLPVEFSTSVAGAKPTMAILEGDLGQHGPVLVTTEQGAGLYASLVSNQLERAGFAAKAAPAQVYVWGLRRAATGCERFEVKVLNTVEDRATPESFEEVGTIGTATVYLGDLKPALGCSGSG